MNKKTYIFSFAIVVGIISLIIKYQNRSHRDLSDIVDHVHLPGRTTPDISPQRLSENQKLVFAVYLIDFIGESNPNDLEHKKIAYQQLKKRMETKQYPSGLVELLVGIINKKLLEIECPESLAEQLDRVITQKNHSSDTEYTNEIGSKLKRYGVDEEKLWDAVTRYVESIPTPTSPVPIWENAANLNFPTY